MPKMAFIFFFEMDPWYRDAYCERQLTNDALTDNLVSDSIVFVVVDSRQFSDRRSSSAQFSSEKRPRSRLFKNWNIKNLLDLINRKNKKQDLCCRLL